MQNLKLGYASWARSHDRWSPVADVDRSAMARLVVMYVRKARAVLIAIAEPMPRPRCVGRAAERPRCSTTSCEKESEVRSENDSEEEETYLVVSGEDDRVGHGQLQRERGGLLCVLLRLSDLVHRGFQGPLQAEGLELLREVPDRSVRPAAQGVEQRELEALGEERGGGERRRRGCQSLANGAEEGSLPICNPRSRASSLHP